MQAIETPTAEGEVRMIRVLRRADVAELLAMRDCIDVVAAAEIAFSSGATVAPPRLTTSIPGRGDHLAMPAALPSSGAFGVKCITVYPDNPERGAPALQGVVIVNDYESGRPLALIDAVHLTAVRTAAASAVATRALANPNAHRLALVGTGVQARTHLEAMLAVRPIREVVVAGRTPESSRRFVTEQSGRFPEVEIRAGLSAEDAVRDAEVICTVSSAREPVINREWLSAGCHINGVGSHGADVRELDGETMRDARVIVDSRIAALRECGDCLLAIAEGMFGEEHVSDEIGDVLAGLTPGRTSAEEITVYQSCGLAVQDLAVARLVYDRAIAAGRGTLVELD